MLKIVPDDFLNPLVVLIRHISTNKKGPLKNRGPFVLVEVGGIEPPSASDLPLGLHV